MSEPFPAYRHWSPEDEPVVIESCGPRKGQGRPGDLARYMADGLAAFFTPTRDDAREVRS